MNKELQKYIKTSIFPLYARNDWAHQLWHIENVIERSIKLSENYNVELDMVYTIAAFHDIGCYLGRKNHEETSAKIMTEDNFIQNFFSKEQIKIMEEAIIDHRGSLEYEPRSIYGKIISSSDRLVSIEELLRSTHSHTLEFYPFLPWEDQITRSYEYIEKKYGHNGYAKSWIPNSEYDKFIIEVKHYLENPFLFEEKLKEIDNFLKNTYPVSIPQKYPSNTIIVEVGIKLDKELFYYDDLLKKHGFTNDFNCETHDKYYTKKDLNNMTENEMKKSCIRLRNEKEDLKEKEMFHLGYKKIFDTKKIDHHYSKEGLKSKIQLQEIENIGLLVYYDNPDYYNKKEEEQWDNLILELNSYGFNFDKSTMGLDKLRTLYYGKDMHSKNQNG